MDKVLCIEDIMKQTFYRKKLIREQLDWVTDQHNKQNFIKENILEAVKKDWTALNMVSATDQTEELCNIAIDQNARAIECVKRQTEELCLRAVRKDGMVLKYCKVQTNKVIKAAIDNYRGAISYVNEPSFSIYQYAVLHYPDAVKYIDDLDVLQKLNKIDWDRHVFTINTVEGEEHPVFISNIMVGFPYTGKEKDTFLIEIWFNEGKYSIEVSREEADRIRDFLDSSDLDWDITDEDN